jgi:O-antigen/teichoic acid export membrane protein
MTPQAPRPTVELSWLVVGHVLSVAGALAAVRLLTEVLPPKVYGLLGLGMTAATFLQQLWFGPLCATTDRFFSPAREAGQLGSFFRVLMRLVARTGTLLGGAFAAVAATLAFTGRSDWAWMLVCAGGFAIASGANNLLDAVQNASRCRHLVALHTGASTWLRLALALLFVWSFGPSASMVLIGYVVGSVIVLVSQFVTFRFVVRPAAAAIEPAGDPDSVWFDRMWSYLWPSLSWGAFTWAFAASDRWSLQSFASTDDVGRYLVLYQLGYYPLSLLGSLVQQWVYPILFAQAGDGTEAHRGRQAMQMGRQWLALMAIAVACAVLVAGVGHRIIFQLLASASYRDISPWLPGMVLASGLFTLGQLATLPLLATAGSQSIARCKIVTSCAGMLLNVAGTWSGGVAGVVVAQVGFAATYAVWVAVLLERQRRRMDRADAVDETPSAPKLAA